MGISILRSFSSNEGYQPTQSNEPKPEVFIIKQVYNIGNHCVAIIHYPHATNFEGNKILVYKNMSEARLRKEKLIDPHFSDKGLAPFARFKPTDEGLKLAIKLCQLLYKEEV